MSFSIRDIEASDIDRIMEIEASSFARPWLREHFMHELGKDSSFCRCIADDGVLQGYLFLSILFDEAEILDFAVSPEGRGKGCGRMLLCDAIEICRANAVATIHLEVRSTSAPAIGLYRSAGFADSGIRKKYYENGIDALLMTLSLER